VLQIVEHRVVNLSNSTFGHVYHLNYPQAMPPFIDFTQHLIAPLGDVISIELQGVEFGDKGCDDNLSIEVRNSILMITHSFDVKVQSSLSPL
jgi:hypothetical protein